MAAIFLEARVLVGFEVNVDSFPAAENVIVHDSVEKDKELVPQRLELVERCRKASEPRENL